MPSLQNLYHYGKNVVRYRNLRRSKIAKLRREEWPTFAKSTDQPLLMYSRKGFYIFLNPLDDAISASIWARGEYFQTDVTRAFSSLLTRGCTVVDIGANVGWYALTAAKLAERVHAFEPDPLSSGWFECP
jgi:hypothetical protein